MNTGKPKCKISIKTKLLGIIIPIVTVIVAALITISYIQSKNIISDSANNLLETSSKNQVNQIESWLNENLSSFRAVKTSLENTELNGTKLQNCWISTMDMIVIIQKDSILAIKTEK